MGDRSAGGWDVFLCYPTVERPAADELREHLVTGGATVFLDHVDIALGDPWAARLAEAQDAARITVVLVSSASDAAFYQRDEIARGIVLSRRGSHRVVPVYLDDGADPPYGLLALQAARVSEAGGLAPIADRVLGLLGLAPRPAPAVDEHAPGERLPVPPAPRRSPFRPGLPLYATDRYPAESRRRLLEVVRADVCQGSNANLIGERRMGRTSLLNHLYAGLLVERSVVGVRVNLQDGVDSADAFWGALLWGLAQSPAGVAAVEATRYRTLDHDPVSSYTEVRRALRDVRTRATAVVLVDEFERCFDAPAAFPLPAFFDNVRSVLGGDAYGPYARAVVATRQPLAEYFTTRQVTSVLPTYLPPRHLELLSPVDAEEVLTQPNPHPLTPAERDQAAAWSAGHPCRLQCAAESWSRAKEEGTAAATEYARLTRQLCLGATTATE